MQKILYKVVNVSMPDSGGFRLEYYVVESTTDIENARVKTYGVEIRKNVGGHMELNEIKTIEDICQNHHETRQILNALARNTVTPTSLSDVIEDILVTRQTPDLLTTMAI